MSPRDHRVTTGFTLVEIMVTLAILAIIVSLAAPGYRQLRATKAVVIAISTVVTLITPSALFSVIHLHALPFRLASLTGWLVSFVLLLLVFLPLTLPFPVSCSLSPYPTFLVLWICWNMELRFLFWGV